MLSVIFSNRSQALLEALIDDMGAAPNSGFVSPFAAEHVIVPGAAQRRAVTLALADARGVCAHVEFSFLAQWLWTQMGHFVELPAESPFAARALEWRIRELFDPAAAGNVVARLGGLRAYIEAADPLLRYEVAREVARQFETYVTYRPDWLARWSAGERIAELAADPLARQHEPWQAMLWERIAGDVGAGRRHPSLSFFERVEARGEAGGDGGTSGPAGRSGLPERAFFFALPAVPPLYLQILKRLSRWIDLRVYVLNPCREYWYEIVDRRRLSWLEARGEAACHEIGNPLLAAWGRQTRAYVDLLLAEGGEDVVIDDDGFVEACTDRDTLLGRVQDSILNLVELDAGILAGLADDRSIEVHVCHSLSRQIEALRDQLLALFAADPALRPADVIVLLPDLDAAAPLIESVFGTGGTSGGERRIPFAITGRGTEASNPVADLLLRLLALPATRLAAVEVFDLLQHPLVSRRLRLDDDSLRRIQGWMRESGMRWGLDGTQRVAVSIRPSPAPDPSSASSCAAPRSADDEFSLRDGLRRLLLGHALASDPDPAPLCQGLLPAGDASGSPAANLGSLWAFVEALAITLERLRVPRPAAAWPPVLHALLADWTADARLDDDGIAALQAVRAAIDRLDADFATAAPIAGRDGAARPAAPTGPHEAATIGVEVVRAALADRLEGPAHGGVPTGAVTFSALPALRGLSARVICLLGMDDGVFPRQHHPAEFDLMARAARRGDRQARDDDRNLFLDLLLGAGDRLQLYTTGRSIRDNAPLPPSVLVSELLDTLAAAIAPAGAEPDALASARRRLIVEHPLQSFSLSLFAPDDPAFDPRRASHDEDTCNAWREALSASPGSAERAAPATVATGDEAADPGEEGEDDDAVDSDGLPFFVVPLPPPGPEWRRVPLPRLRRFFRHPARSLLQERLGIAFDYSEDPLPNEDPFTLEPLARSRLWSALLARSRSTPAASGSAPDDEARASARAMRLAPSGPVGDALLEPELVEIARLTSAIARLRAAPALPDHDFVVDLALGAESWQVHGTLGDLSADGLLVVREGDAGGRDFLDAWLAHLALNACPPPEAALSTTLVARNGLWRFVPMPDARAQLEKLIACYRLGLSTPLHFYPRTAWSYVEDNGSLVAARKAFRSRPDVYRGEGDDPWWRLALRGLSEALDDDFMALAEEIYGPLRRAREEIES